MVAYWQDRINHYLTEVGYWQEKADSTPTDQAKVFQKKADAYRATVNRCKVGLAKATLPASN